MIDLEAIKGRLAAATPGPWYVDESLRGVEAQTHGYPVEIVAWTGRADAVLIAHAPGDIAALVAEVERLRAECDGSAKHTMALEQQNIALLRWQAVASDAHVDHLCNIIRALAVADETPRVLRDLSVVGVEEEVRRAFAAERINREKSEVSAQEWRKKAEDAEALTAEVERLRADNARIMLEAERHRRIADEAIERIESAEEERAAVVAYLRGLADDAAGRMFVPHSRAKAYIAAADTIERGEHRRKGDE